MTVHLTRRVVFCLLAFFAAVAVWGQEAEPWVTELSAPQFFAVRVADVDAAVAWYQKLFGLEELDGSAADDGSWRIANLKSDALHVEIIRDDRAAAAERPLGFAKVGFRVPDVEEVADRVDRATGERPKIVDFEAHRLRILQLRDPEGNVIQLTSELELPPAAPVASSAAPAPIANLVSKRSENEFLWDGIAKTIKKKDASMQIVHIYRQRFEAVPTMLAVVQNARESRSVLLTSNGMKWKIRVWGDARLLPAGEERADCPIGHVATMDGTCLTPPILVRRVEPLHPRVLSDSGPNKSTVRAHYVIRADGSVGEVEVVEVTKPGKGFEEATIKALEQWQYIPAMVEGEPVAIGSSATFSFARR